MATPSVKIESLYDQALKAFEAQNPQEAVTLCREALKVDFDHVPTILLAAKALKELGKLGQANNYLKKANRLQPDNPEILFDYGLILIAVGQKFAGKQILAQAVIKDPENEKARASFIQSLDRTIFQQFDQALKDALIISLDDDTLSHRLVFTAWYSLLKTDSHFSPWIQLEKADTFESFLERFDPDAFEDILNDPYLCLGVRRLIMNNGSFERTICFLRRYFLLHADQKTAERYRRFISSVAMQAFYNEYMFYFNEEEQAALEKAKQEKKPDIDHLLILGCYEPLHKQKEPEQISARLKASDDQDLQLLALKQIDEPLKELEIKKDIPSFTEIEDEVSQIVKQQYEESPYPRWRSIGGVELSQEQIQARKGLEILVAGCGTGQQTAAMSVNFPNAHITAFDLSFSSLSYAIRVAQDLELNNLDFYQGDLLKVADFNKDFDFIACGGVLHHMESPKAGLKALRDVLKERGTMKIALYSEIAREKIVYTQNWIKEQGYPATPQGIRQFRYDTMHKTDMPELRKMKPFVGIFSLSETRDTYFNVQEHRFTCLQLKDLIKELDLDLLQFEMNRPKIVRDYLEYFPEDKNVTNLENWHLYEQKYPNTFLGMYTMLLAKKGEYEEGERPAWLIGDDTLTY